MTVLAAAPLAGLVADALVGDPRRGHPVAGFGRVAGAVEGWLWADRRIAGVGHTAVCVVPAVALTAAADRRLPPVGRAILLITVTWAAVGARTLGREAAAVADAVEAVDLDGARRRITALVGRDPTDMDADALCRAATESVAENTADAVVAPLLYAAAGPWAVVMHRCINTLDAMVGHRSRRYRRFGWASARSDDLANMLPARLTAWSAVLLAPTIGGRMSTARRVLRRDGRRHPSPNAGRCEAAFAGALGVRLGGENRYGDRVEVRGPHGDGGPPTVADVRRAVQLSRRVGVLAALLATCLRLTVGGRL